MLFEEYGCSDLLLSVSADEEEVRTRLAKATGPGRADLVARLDEHRARLKEETRAMWRGVDEILGRELAST
jgi:hypothetical protein